MHRYQWLLFDADGTVFDYDKAEGVALRLAFERVGIEFQAGVLEAYRQINLVLWQLVEKGEIAPAIVKVRRFEQLLQQFGIACSAQQLSNGYLESLSMCSELVADAAEVLTALQQKYQLAILTNGLQVVQRGRLARSIIRDHIEKIIISEEIGFAKPSREYFDAALARLGNPDRRRVLMIGDGWDSDIRGAVQYGIDACWYNPAHKPRPDPTEITREISSLRELPEWLE